MKAWFRPAQVANIAFLGGWFEATGTEELLALLVNPFVGNPFDAQQNRAGRMSENKRLLKSQRIINYNLVRRSPSPLLSKLYQNRASYLLGRITVFKSVKTFKIDFIWKIGVGMQKNKP